MIDIFEVGFQQTGARRGHRTPIFKIERWQWVVVNFSDAAIPVVHGQEEICAVFSKDVIADEVMYLRSSLRSYDAVFTRSYYLANPAIPEKHTARLLH